MAGTPALGLNVGAGAMDGHLLQDPYRQDTFEATVTRELRLSRIEMANLMHRLSSVEKVQEQLLGILINQQTTMLNGASVTAAASSIPATSIPASASTSTSLPASILSALTGTMAAVGGVHGLIGPSGINVRGGGISPAQLQQHLNQQQAQQLHLNQQQAQQLQQLQSQQQLDLGGITIREAPLMQSQAAAPLAPKPEPAPAPPVKPNDPASQPLANISGLSNHLAGVNPLLGLGLGSGTGLDPGGGGGGGTGLAGGGLATAAGLNLGGLGSGLPGQPGLLYSRQP